MLFSSFSHTDTSKHQQLQALLAFQTYSVINKIIILILKFVESLKFLTGCPAFASQLLKSSYQRKTLKKSQSNEIICQTSLIPLLTI